MPARLSPRGIGQMSDRPIRVVAVAGARPNFMKIAPLMREFCSPAREGAFESTLVHTGQHYDYQLSGIFFEELELGPPDHFLDARNDGGRSAQMADVMVKFDAVLAADRPDLVVVVGDVISTVFCSLGAKIRDIPVAHVEAGLRANDRSMPEEITRVATDAIADLLFTTDVGADENNGDVFG